VYTLVYLDVYFMREVGMVNRAVVFMFSIMLVPALSLSPTEAWSQTKNKEDNQTQPKQKPRQVAPGEGAGQSQGVIPGSVNTGNTTTYSQSSTGAGAINSQGGNLTINNGTPK
jgi:hypothetical protein